MSDQDNFTKVLDKLTDSFDDFKERLIRIEENVKDVKSVKVDVEDLKVKNASLTSKADSAHKRIDGLSSERITKLENNQQWLWRTVIAGLILGGIGLLFLVIQEVIKNGLLVS